MLGIIRVIGPVDGTVKERGERGTGNQTLALIPVRGFQRDGFADGIVQVEPGRKIIELVDHQDQEILLFPVNGADGGSGKRRLQQKIKAVDVLLVHPFRRCDIVACQFKDLNGGFSGIEHAAADDVRRSFGIVPLEFCGNDAVFHALTGERGKVPEHVRIVRIHKADQVGIKDNLVIAVIGKIPMKIPGKRHKFIFRNGAGNRIAVLVENIALQNQKRLERTE